MKPAETEIKLPKYRYNPELDTIKPEEHFTEKLEKAKAYFQEHGFPDFDKLIREAKEKQTK